MEVPQQNKPGERSMDMTYKKKSDKRMSLKEAVKQFVLEGGSVAFSGMAGEQCVAPAHEIIRQKIGGLTLIGDSPCDPGDLMAGAGLIDRMEIAWCGYAVAGMGPNFRRAYEKKIPKGIKINDHSNFGMGLRYMAGAMGVPFMPTKSFLGSDLLTYNEDIKVMDDPFGSGPIALVPAICPDVAFVHCTRADKHGNAQIFGFSANAENLARCAAYTVITCEKLVSTEEIRETANLTIIPQYTVDAVVEVPFGSHPWNYPYLYQYDMPFHMDMQKIFKTREGFLEWLHEWIYGVDEWEGYLQKVGYDRLFKLADLERKFQKVPY